MFSLAGRRGALVGFRPLAFLMIIGGALGLLYARTLSLQDREKRIFVVCGAAIAIAGIGILVLRR